jgi:uncharacterized ferritin-like protein (DUF455 family)
MEYRDWALTILSAETLDSKLAEPGDLTDHSPGSAIIWKEPARPPGMGFSRHTREHRLPSFQEHHDPDNRAICLHRFAGHELLAVEIMAFTLLAFPDAPSTFRRGLVHTLKEEQEHVRLYMHQMERLGIQFGDLPLYRHFWRFVPHLNSPLHYISMMSLTFEMANLDFAPMYGKSFAHFGDQESAALMAQILKDEISHVRFGWHWLQRLKAADQTPWDAWQQTLSTTLLPLKRARGFMVHEAPRREAGITPDWIANLKAL